jgi:peptide/nickel transport system substrate-binding protein
MNSLEKYQDATNSAVLSRREFITKLSALGLSVSLAPLMSPTIGHGKTPVKGGRFRLGVRDYASTDTLDPTTPNGKGMWCLNYQLRNNLIEEGVKGKLIPELAESWDSSPDLTQWVFKIRQGVEFSNGKPLEAEDVVHSINMHRDKSTTSSVASLLAPITDIKISASNEITITLASGNIDFPAILTIRHVVIVPRDREAMLKGVGTGGYILEKFEPGIRSIARRNPNYWKEDRAHFDEIEVVGISDVTSRTNALISGQLDAIGFCDRRTLDLLARNDALQILRSTGKTHYYFPMRVDTKPYDNKDIRQALKYAVDRKHIVNTILNGYGTVGNDQPINAAYPFYADDLPQIDYDPDKAKFHIKKSGLKDTTFEIYVSNTPFAGAVDAAVLMQQQALKAGIKIRVNRVPEDGYWSDTWKKKPWYASMKSGYTTENIMLSTVYQSTAAWNETYWKNERFDKLLVAARSEKDTAKRREMYREMQAIIATEGGSLIPMFADIVDAASTKVGYDEIAANEELDGLRCGERWWFKS